jgi:hypothetical protein
MDEFPMDASVTYQDMEPMIEAEVYDPLPEGLVEPQWLELPELEQNWLELPELEQDWLQTIDQGEPTISPEMPDLEQDLDLEH